MDHADRDSAQPPPSGASGAADVRERRKPRIEVLGSGPAAAAEPGRAAAARPPRIEMLGGDARGASEPRSPGMSPGEPQPMPAPRRRRAGLLNSRIPLLAMLALLALLAVIGYLSSQGGSDNDRSAREDAETSEGAEVPADAEREYPGMSAPEAQVERPEVQVASTEETESPESSGAAEAEGPEPADAKPAVPEPADAEPAAPADETNALATVRAFYGALSEGDGAAAAQWVIPAKRASGPLSAGQLDRYFSSFRRPLRVRRVAQVDADTVRVAYDYVLADGRLCRGQASVDVVRSGERTLVRGIRTQGPC